ncbi:MFS transporter [Devosia insulae DS-56]|uniref:MFS transporter n=1 Tax=Devosia insulae DS-56 TaxID=1116389 RepID=A0A1E5XH19_9HYPH|nr:MFS transporter [Devosia insulae]OEO27906.1 MFS transporter [Devosia insulae DS-56]
MSSALKIYALFIGSALLMFGGGLQGLLLSVRGAEEGFSLTALGLIGTGWSVGFVAGSITVPLLVKRVGHIRAYSIMSAIGTVTILLNLLWVQDIGWIVMRAFSGFCFAGAAMIVESWLNEVADNRSRGTIFSVYTTINMAASTVGQLAMAVTGTFGHIPFVVGAIAFICALLPSALTSTPQPRPISSARLDVVLLYKTSPLAVIAAFACGMANGTFGTLAPVYGFEQKLDASTIAYLFAVTAVVGAVAQTPFGRLSDKIDRRLVIVGLSGFAAVIGLVTVLLNPSSGVLMFILFGLYGFGAYPLYAIAVAHANDFARDGEFGRVAGGMLLILGIGLAIGPIIASWVMNAIAPVGLFIVTATFHGALAVTAFLRMKIRPVRDAAGRVRFRAMSAEKGVSPGTVTLDPRGEEKPTPRPAAPAAAPQPQETELLVPDPIEPTVIVERHVKSDGPGDTDKSDKPKPE